MENKEKSDLTLNSSSIEYWNIYKSKTGKNPSERYLRELINAGNYFQSPLIEVEDQSHGEPDVITEDGLYGLDFKLFLSESEGEARSIILKTAQDSCGYYPLFNILRNRGFQELMNPEMLNNGAPLPKGELKRIKKFLDICKIKKNIFFFVPRYVYAPIDYTVNFFNKTIAGLFNYREFYTNGFDTYFAWLHVPKFADPPYDWDFKNYELKPVDINFVMSKYNHIKGELEIIDIIPLSKNNYFLRHHYNYLDWLKHLFKECGNSAKSEKS